MRAEDYFYSMHGWQRNVQNDHFKLPEPKTNINIFPEVLD
jgi:hypothetical protein